MTTRDDTDGAWRDEQTLPLSELSEAMATSSSDGQADDLAGNDAGIEQTIDRQDSSPVGGRPDQDPDPTSAESRRLRPDFNGPAGPH